MTDIRFQNWREKVYATGDMGAIKIGVSQDAVRLALGEPDSISENSPAQKNTVFSYADIQFHFDPLKEFRLSMICIPDVDRIPL